MIKVERVGDTVSVQYSCQNDRCNGLVNYHHVYELGNDQKSYLLPYCEICMDLFGKSMESSIKYAIEAHKINGSEKFKPILHNVDENVKVIAQLPCQKDGCENIVNYRGPVDDHMFFCEKHKDTNARRD